MIERVTFDGISFLDANGIYRVVYGCSLKSRRELAHALAGLGHRLDVSPFKSVADLYDHDLEFRAIADHCLGLCGIDPSWLNVAQLTEFLLPHRDEEGNPQLPILQRLNFPEPERPVPQEEAGSYPDAIAALWTHTKNLNDALQAAGYQPGELPGWDEMQEVLKAKNRMENPKEAEEANAAAQIEKSLKAGNWFVNKRQKRKIASPQETDQLMQKFVQ